MTKYGGVPEEYQVDGYLGQISASTNQKNTLATQRTTHNHKMPIGKIEDLLAATT